MKLSLALTLVIIACVQAVTPSDPDTTGADPVVPYPLTSEKDPVFVPPPISFVMDGLEVLNPPLHFMDSPDRTLRTQTGSPSFLRLSPAKSPKLPEDLQVASSQFASVLDDTVPQASAVTTPTVIPSENGYLKAPSWIKKHIGGRRPREDSPRNEIDKWNRSVLNRATTYGTEEQLLELKKQFPEWTHAALDGALTKLRYGPTNPGKEGKSSGLKRAGNNINGNAKKRPRGGP